MSAPLAERGLIGHEICRSHRDASQLRVSLLRFTCSWPARLHEIYAAKGLTDIVVDRRPYPKDKLPYLLDTVLVACEEMCYSTLDRIGGGRGDHCRDLIQKVFHARSNTAFNLDRLTVIGRKPEAKEESAA